MNGLWLVQQEACTPFRSGKQDRMQGFTISHSSILYAVSQSKWIKLAIFCLKSPIRRPLLLA